MKKENIHSHLTAKKRERLSFPAHYLLRNRPFNGRILDYGCGFGKDVELLMERGHDIWGYDKYYFPQLPEGPFDTILCFYVLNVLEPEEQADVLMEISRLLKPGGKAYFAVRRDIHNSGYRLHKLHNEFTYQCNVRLPYESIFRNDSCEIYEYQHFNHLSHDTNCVFCGLGTDRELLLESATALAFYDAFPVSPGHALIIPKRHVENYFALSVREQMACLLVLDKLKNILTERHSPAGFNIGINIGEASGQTVSHAHIHLIPRYKNDVDDPRGGVRGVIPEKRIY